MCWPRVWRNRKGREKGVKRPFFPDLHAFGVVLACLDPLFLVILDLTEFIKNAILCKFYDFHEKSIKVSLFFCTFWQLKKWQFWEVKKRVIFVEKCRFLLNFHLFWSKRGQTWVLGGSKIGEMDFFSSNFG